jgi:hypothetical protein
MVTFNSTVKSQLFRALKNSFPDATIDSDDMEALAICIHKRKVVAKGGKLPDELQSIDVSPYAAELEARAAQLPFSEQYTTTRKSGDKYRYYWATAVHTRKSPAGFKPFTGEIAMARVTLHKDQPKTYRTAFGTIEKGDHLIDTVYEANQKYAKHLGYSLQRLDLVTPARDIVRFGAISVFLGYKKASDKKPSCYILEAGTATGQPKVLYLGKKLGDPINAYSGYRPTPFACPDHAYYGTLTAKNGDHPGRLHITSRKVTGGVSQEPYMDVDIQFRLQTGGLLNIWPGFLIARAAGIVLSRSLTKKISTDCSEGITPGSNNA